MQSVITPEIREILEAIHYRPAVSIIVPFQPKINLKTELRHTLKLACDRVQKELDENYLDEMNKLVMHKLHQLINQLNFNTHKKSIAIFVSPVFEKVLYLDIAVNEKIVVNDSFEIRDIIYNKKQQKQFLVLMLSSKESKVYLGNHNTLEKISSIKAEAIYAYQNDAPQRVANFSDINERKEILTEKFIRNIDQSLDNLLKNYPLPIFVLGTEKLLGHFKKITKNGGAIIETITGNYEEKTTHEILTVLAPKLTNWENIKQFDIIRKLKLATEKKQITIGIKNVWKDTMNKKGKLLVVEKNFSYAAEHSLSNSSSSNIYKAIEPYNKFSYIKDAVDDIIEKVLENGGDVEFVEDNMLKEFEHIALIHYY